MSLGEYNVLKRAIILGNAQAVKVCLAKLGNSFNITLLPGHPIDKRGYGVLHFAAMADDAATIQAICNAGHSADSTPPSTTPLMLAAAAGNIKAMQALITGGANVNACSGSHGSALHFATRKNQTAAIELLLKAGANINLPNNKGSTALMHAVDYHQTEATNTLLNAGADATLTNQRGRMALDYAIQKNQQELIRLLAARLSHKNLPTPYKQVIILGPKLLNGFAQYKGNKDVLIIGNGKDDVTLTEIATQLYGRIDPNTRIDIHAHGRVKDNTHMIRLHSARMVKTKNLFRVIGTLSDDTNTHLWSCKGATANADTACLVSGTFVAHSPKTKKTTIGLNTKGSRIAIKAHLNGQSPQQTFIEGLLKGTEGATFTIIEKGQPVHWVFTLPKDPQTLLSTPKYKAYLKARIIDFNAFLRRHNRVPVNDTTSLIESMTDHINQSRLIAIKNVFRRADTVTIWGLIAAEADLDIADSHGWTILMDAINRNQPKVVELLIIGRANLDLFDITGCTALMKAVAQGLRNITTLLLDGGANANLQNRWGETALMRAVRHNQRDMVQLLTQNGAHLDSQNSSGKTALMQAVMAGNSQMVEQLVTLGANLDLVDNYGNTALIQAIESGHSDIARLLIAFRAKTDHQNIWGHTALTQAVRHGKADIARLLIAFGANIDMQNSTGQTPLMEAVRHNQRGMVELLIDKGANIDCLNTLKQTALIQAIILKQNEMAKLLISLGAELEHTDIFGKTALMWTNNQELIEMLQLSISNVDTETTPFEELREGLHDITNLSTNRLPLSDTKTDNTSFREATDENAPQLQLPQQGLTDDQNTSTAHAQKCHPSWQDRMHSTPALIPCY